MGVLKRLKSGIAGALAMSMVFSLFPATAYAQETEVSAAGSSSSESSVEEAVAGSSGASTEESSSEVGSSASTEASSEEQIKTATEEGSAEASEENSGEEKAEDNEGEILVEEQKEVLSRKGEFTALSQDAFLKADGRNLRNANGELVNLRGYKCRWFPCTGILDDTYRSKCKCQRSGYDHVLSHREVW